MTQQPKETCQRTCRGPKTDNLENLCQKLKLRQFEILATSMDDADGDEALAAISAPPVSLRGTHTTLEAQTT